MVPFEDGCNRPIKYLRISVTDRCDMACTYCRPSRQGESSGDCGLLPLRDLLRLTRIFARLGVRKTRITGGEPLIRQGLIRFIQQVNAIDGIDKISITTNGSHLAPLAPKLRNAGVSGINISLDSLRPDRFLSITGHPRLDDVTEGILAAIDNGFDSVKLNVVLMRGVNDDEISAFVDLSQILPVEIRFIEFMPVTSGLWNQEQLLPMSEVKQQIESEHRLTPCDKEAWGGPAKIYRIEGAVGRIGFISSMTKHFCGDCNRLRLTSSGRLLNCLFDREGVDLGTLVSANASDQTIADTILQAVARKPKIRALPHDDASLKNLPMTSIGG